MADLEGIDRQLDWDERQNRVSSGVTALLAKVFGGQPIAPGTSIADLTAEQQQALQIIARVGKDWWTVDSVMSEPMASYGLDFYEESYAEFLAGQRAAQ